MVGGSHHGYVREMDGDQTEINVFPRPKLIIDMNQPFDPSAALVTEKYIRRELVINMGEGATAQQYSRSIYVEASLDQETAQSLLQNALFAAWLRREVLS